MLAAREDLAEKAIEMASSKGFTLFGMINNLLELAIRADNLGFSLEVAVDNYELIKAVRGASYTLVLESLLYNTTEIAYKTAKERTLQTWFDAGVWVGKQYIARGVEDPFASLGRDLKAFSWNIPEFTLGQLEKQLSIRVISPRFSESYTLLFSRFLEVIIEAFDYGITYKEIGKGNIRLEAAKRGVNGKG
jgi:hypothetical protein